MIQLIRKGLTLTFNDEKIPARGSSNIPITLVNDASYQEYTVVPYVGWVDVHGYAVSTVVKYENGIITLPAQAFQNNGVIAISIALIDNNDTTHIEKTLPTTINVINAPSTNDVLPREDLWTSAVDALVTELNRQIQEDVNNMLTRIDSIATTTEGLQNEVQNQQTVITTQQTEVERLQTVANQQQKTVESIQNEVQNQQTVIGTQQTEVERLQSVANEQQIKATELQTTASEQQTIAEAQQTEATRLQKATSDAIDYMQQRVAELASFSMRVVDVLPVTGEPNIIYLVPKSPKENDSYNEFLWVESTSSFEHIGSTDVTLDDYLQKSGGTMSGDLKLKDKTIYFVNGSNEDVGYINFSRQTNGITLSALQGDAVLLSDNDRPYFFSTATNEKDPIALTKDLESYLEKTGGTLTGYLTFNNGYGIQGITTNEVAEPLLRLNSQNEVVLGSSNLDLKFSTSNNPITVSTPNGSYTLVGAEEISQALDIIATELENKQNKVLSGTAEPDASLGVNGDVYVMYE